MQAVTTIGLDIAKSVFQIHGVDAAGNVIVRRQLKRRYVLPFFQRLPPCLVGIEACASSHHWSRELKALGPESADGAEPILNARERRESAISSADQLR
jgi:transposase